MGIIGELGALWERIRHGARGVGQGLVHGYVVPALPPDQQGGQMVIQLYNPNECVVSVRAQAIVQGDTVAGQWVSLCPREMTTLAEVTQSWLEGQWVLLQSSARIGGSFTYANPCEKSMVAEQTPLCPFFAGPFHQLFDFRNQNIASGMVIINPGKATSVKVTLRTHLDRDLSHLLQPELAKGLTMAAHESRFLPLGTHLLRDPESEALVAWLELSAPSALVCTTYLHNTDQWVGLDRLVGMQLATTCGMDRSMGSNLFRLAPSLLIP